MDAAKEVFDKLSQLAQSESAKMSAQDQLLDFCEQVLGSIEHVHVDFKEKADPRHAKLGEDDKRNLAKAISGFANSGSGVLIWGIEDKTIKPKPIDHVRDFIDSILTLAPQVTDPPVQGIDGNWIPAKSGHGLDGFGLVYIPESLLPPHRVLLKLSGVQDRYYVRSGESFVAASHTQLEDMFGRRPRPNLSLITTIIAHSANEATVELWVIVGIRITGRGAAKSPFLSVRVREPYRISRYGIDGNERVGLPRLVSSRGSDATKYASSDVVIYPGIDHDVTCITAPITMSQNAFQTPDLVIDFAIAAEGIRPVEGQEVIKGIDLRLQANQSSR